MFIELVGEEQAEEALRTYIKQSLPQPKLVKLGRPRKHKLGGHNIGKKTVYWKPEEKAFALKRAREIYTTEQNWSKVCSTLAQELGRTTSSLYNFIYNSGITKENV